MYRLLIVDDERDVVEYFYRVFTEEAKISFEVYTASSAQEALECLDRIRVDVVLSDIKMPKMNGIQMYEVIKSRWPRCRVVFLSGVMEFDYVYSSIQKKDVRYLTKLEPTEKIISAIEEVIEEIEKSYREQNALQKAQHQLEQALPLLQNQYLYKILNNIYEPDENVQQRLDELNIELDISKEIILVGGIFDNIPKGTNTTDLEKKIYYFKSIASNYFSENYYNICYISEQKYFIWLLQKKEANNRLQQSLSTEVLLNGQLEYIQSASSQIVGVSISFAYSEHQVPFSTIWEEFINIKRALGSKSLLPADSLISKTYEVEKSTLLYDDPAVLISCRQLVKLNILEGYLELGQKQEFFNLFSNIVDCLKNVKSMNYGPALEIYYSVATIFMKHINLCSLTERLAFKIELNKLMRIDEHEIWKNAVEYLYSLADIIFELRFDSVDTQITDTVLYIQKYICDNLEKDLTLITLADKVHLNPSYFSRLFKEKTNENLYDYILEMRMAKAKELLKKSANKIQDISCAVGYDSAQSFTRVFRKYVGKSPSEYRDER